jgi:hypothetical protein
MLILPQLAMAEELVISDVRADSSLTTAIIRWKTNLASNSTVNYGTVFPLTHSVSDSSMVTDHNMFLPDLSPGTKYYFEVISNGVRSPATPDVYWSFTTLTVGAYSIILEPACGTCGEATGGLCGQVIRVTAVVAGPGTYYICWDSPAAANVKATFTTTTAGSRTLEFYLPEAVKGNHTVYLADSAYGSKASATFEVFPSVKIAPEQGPVGTNVTLKGYGFGASQQIQIKFKDTVVTTTTANSVGSWTVFYTIPATPADGYTFDAQASEGQTWVTWVSKYFRVTPKITVTPGSGTVGQAVEVKGTGFQSKEKNIQITFDGEVRKKDGIAVDENGSWSAVISVPPRQSGTYKIDASGALTRARDVDDVYFILGAGILVEPISAYVGDTIAVAGGGFRPGETGIKVYFDGIVVTSTTITADIYGCWKSSFTLPASAYGPHTVSASGDVTPSVTANLSTQAKILELSPVEGAPGDSVSLTANGFGGSKKLTVTIGGTAVPGNGLTTQSNGNVVISFRVPKGSTEGIRTLVMADEGGATASVDFTVTKKTLSTTPLPLSPKDSKLRSGIVTFNWQGVTGSTDHTYTLEISRTAGSGNIWSKAGIVESSYALTQEEALPKGTYYWRVKIVDNYGNEGAWSDYIEFTVSPIPTWVWVLVGLVVLVGLMVVAYRETKFKVTE